MRRRQPAARGAGRRGQRPRDDARNEQRGGARADRALDRVEGRGVKDKVAVVTGGAGGLGSATARRLAAAGARVLVVDVDGDRAKEVAQSLPGDAEGIRGDVAVEGDVERYVTAAVERFGRLDLHHLNAGIPGPLDPLPEV